MLVKSIIDMAGSLRLNVVAEGVEDPQQHRFLSRAGCQYGQGYLYSKPLSPEEFDAWLVARESVAAIAEPRRSTIASRSERST